MSAKLGDKFIIEIGEIFNGAESGQTKYRIKGFDNLVFDDKGIMKLTSFEYAQQTAYNNGYGYGFDEGYKQGAINGSNADVIMDDSYIKGFQAAALKYTKIIHDMTEAYQKLTDLEEEN